MKVRFITYRDNRTGKRGLGMVDRSIERAVFLEELGIYFRDMNDLIVSLSSRRTQKRTDSVRRQLEEAAGETARFVHPLRDMTLLAPIETPRQDIICLGLNYEEHVDESMRFKRMAAAGADRAPTYFSKRVARATGDGAPIPYDPLCTRQLDYEVELAVIIGASARNVKASDVHKHIFGYTILNDVTARDVQKRHGQWFFGKSADGYAPMGPCIVTADEAGYPPKLTIQSRVNGELRQNCSTERFLFDIDYVVAELSSMMTLMPGTIISTGTPGGAGMGFDPPHFLQPGDEVACTIEGIGTLTNKVQKI